MRQRYSRLAKQRIPKKAAAALKGAMKNLTGATREYTSYSTKGFSVVKKNMQSMNNNLFYISTIRK